jgi:hydrogenase maturation protease
MNSNRILVAGIGNIFLGDDAFGVETVRSLMREPLPNHVHVVDFGIRGYDLAYALADDANKSVILVDAAPRGEPPGTVYHIEPDVSGLSQTATLVNGHTLNPVTVLLMARSLNEEAIRPGRVHLVGCEPAVLEPEDGSMELSPAVSAAVPGAVEMIRSLIDQLLLETHPPGARPEAARDPLNRNGEHHHVPPR